MGIFSVEIIQALEELEPSLRKLLIKVLYKIEEAIGETVRREDFLELKNIVKNLAEKVEQLAEAQKRTEEELKNLLKNRKNLLRLKEEPKKN